MLLKILVSIIAIIAIVIVLAGKVVIEPSRLIGSIFGYVYVLAFLKAFGVISFRGEE